MRVGKELRFQPLASLPASLVQMVAMLGCLNKTDGFKCVFLMTFPLTPSAWGVSILTRFIQQALSRQCIAGAASGMRGRG